MLLRLSPHRTRMTEVGTEALAQPPTRMPPRSCMTFSKRTKCSLHVKFGDQPSLSAIRGATQEWFKNFIQQGREREGDSARDGGQGSPCALEPCVGPDVDTDLLVVYASRVVHAPVAVQMVRVWGPCDERQGARTPGCSTPREDPVDATAHAPFFVDNVPVVKWLCASLVKVLGLQPVGAHAVGGPGFPLR